MRSSHSLVAWRCPHAGERSGKQLAAQRQAGPANNNGIADVVISNDLAITLLEYAEPVTASVSATCSMAASPADKAPWMAQ